MNWTFKVIQGHPYWCRQEVPMNPKRCVVVMCNSCRRFFTKIMATRKQQIRRIQRPHSALRTTRLEKPANIYS